MSRAKKVLLVIACLILLSQIPFAYRRYKLGQLSAKIQMLNGEHRSSRADDAWTEYQGVMHVHSFLGGHSSGNFQEIIQAAQANKLHFVVMTEHAESLIDTSALTVKGKYGDVLFINGNEVNSSSGDRLLSIPGDARLAGSAKSTTEDIVKNTHNRDGMSIVAYPDEYRSAVVNYDGMEVYNVFTNAKRINWLVAVFDSLWSHGKYPDLLFANYYQRPVTALKKWDERLAQGKAVGTAGNDSHANIGFSLNDGSGKKILGIELDPYETSFRLVRLHVLMPRDRTLETNTLLNALKSGHCFIGFDLLGNTSGFRFEARNTSKLAIQGDEISYQPDTKLKVTLPIPGRILLIKNGAVELDESGVREKEIPVGSVGVYRVEAYLPDLGNPAGNQPWVISNPIYVR